MGMDLWEDELYARLMDWLARARLRAAASRNVWLTTPLLEITGKDGFVTVEMRVDLDCPIEELADLMDPRGWSRQPALSETYRIAERPDHAGEPWPCLTRNESGQLTAARANDPIPLGSSWRGFLFERAQWDSLAVSWGELRNVLEIDFRVDRAARRVALDYSLFRCLDSRAGRISLEGGLLGDGGYARAEWSPDRPRVAHFTATKRVRHCDLDGSDTVAASRAPGVVNVMLAPLLTQWFGSLAPLRAAQAEPPSEQTPRMGIGLPPLDRAASRLFGATLETLHMQQRGWAALCDPRESWSKKLSTAASLAAQSAEAFRGVWSSPAADSGARPVRWSLAPAQEAVTARRVAVPRDACVKSVAVDALRSDGEPARGAKPLGIDHVEAWIDPRTSELVIALQGVSRSPYRAGAAVSPGSYRVRVDVTDASQRSFAVDAEVSIEGGAWA